MKISDWLDEKEAENVDVSQIELPKDISFDAVADETLYFKEDNPCGLLCTENHPFSKVERFGHWFSSEMKWRLFTKDKALALKAAKEHIE